MPARVRLMIAITALFPVDSRRLAAWFTIENTTDFGGATLAVSSRVFRLPILWKTSPTTWERRSSHRPLWHRVFIVSSLILFVDVFHGISDK